MSQMRKGWTTGACAAAAAKAAATFLRTGQWPDPVTIRLPKGVQAQFHLAATEGGAGWAMAGVVKDAGDDPDVTHGALILARVEQGPPGCGLIFKAGQGVGVATLPGLPIAIGEPAVTPGPRAQIAANLAEFGQDFIVTLSIPGGEALAKQTMNARLGVVGGLSILGTTGVVTPYSNAAWIGAVHRAVDVARANGLDHVAGATGDASERAVGEFHGLNERALIDIGGFAGAFLKYLRRNPVRRVTLAGGFAKMSKLAAGGLDLHSKQSSVDVAFLAGLAGDSAVSARIAKAVSAAQALELAQGYPLGQRVAERGLLAARAALSRSDVLMDVLVVDRAGRVIGHAS
ncbi:putative cobalt-precorrin-6A synthase (deacetylating) [Rhodospirillaceae bacterium LM-1]|nr:putative cobalt-precorrin-6A synthase (deacetylating) [Rhodospirillaceae bacterium LM-1]